MPLRRNRLAGLLAVFAMALQGFWPALAQAQAQAAGQSLFGTICSVDGARSIDLSTGKLPADGGAGKHRKHCALCVAGGERLPVLAPAPVPPLLPSAGPAESVATRPASPLAFASSTPAQPRAPPVRI
jgi:hypothetical protein